MVSHRKDFEKLSHLILPGVGSYASAIKKLHAKNLFESIKDFSETKKPILGICIGMQILNDNGTEGGSTEGLGLISGQTIPLSEAEGLYLPHVGWNELSHNRDHPLLNDIKPNVDFYFVNSYYFDAYDSQDIISYSEHGQKFPAIVAKNNIIGVQFHPEKSQSNGLRMIDNFCTWDGEC